MQQSDLKKKLDIRWIYIKIFLTGVGQSVFATLLMSPNYAFLGGGGGGVVPT